MPGAGTIATVTRSAEPAGVLVSAFDSLLLDLDGVLYIGEAPVPHAAQALAQASADFAIKRAYITNNASRTPEQVVDVLAGVGVPAELSEIITSAQVAAEFLAGRLAPGARVLVVGGEGLERALEANGLKPVHQLEDEPSAVVQGFHPNVGWRDLATAAAAVHRGLIWVASNADMTIPMPQGLAPGNGTLVAAVTAATGKTPVVVGKPNTPAIEAAIDRLGSLRPLIIGDRLDTDIEAAARAEVESLLVMTGVTGVRAVCAADVLHRPTYICADLRGLALPYARPTTAGNRVELEGWVATWGSAGVALVSSGPDPIKGLRVFSRACWASADSQGAELGDNNATFDLLQAGIDKALVD